MHRAAALLPLLLVLAGCKLVDQRTFERTPETPGAATLAQPALPPLPDARLQPANPAADWQAELDQVAQQALARNPGAHFDLLTPIPSAAPRAEQDRFARQGAQDAQDVANALLADGIDPSHITIGYVGDAGQPAREVRLYVR